MSVRFACTACQQKLSVGSRKSGSTVKCPRCRASIVVPTPEQAAAALAMSQAAQVPKPTPISLAELAVYDEAPPTTVVSGNHSSASQRTRVDKNLVALPRYMLYAQAALLAVAVLSAFVMGFLSGRGTRGEPEQSAARPPLAVAGRVVYNANGQQSPDAGAVVIALPAAAAPRKKIPTAGLSPRDPPAPQPSAARELIDLLGGGYARADRQGEFSLTLSPGSYQVTVVSAHAHRPLGTEPAAGDLEQLGKLLDGAAEWIGPSKYLLAIRRVPDETPLQFDLGASGE